MLDLDRIRVIGHADAGAVDLAGAHVAGQLGCTGADLRNDSGPALNAISLQVDQTLYLNGGFTAIGSGLIGTVDLFGAHIGGSLYGEGAALHNQLGPALYAPGVQVGLNLYLTVKFTATGGAAFEVVDLTGAQVGGAFLFAPKQLEHRTNPHWRLAVDGLTYTGVPGWISPQAWRELLREGTPRYAAQPYQQLAAGHRAMGDERQTRETLIAQRDDQLARTHPRWPEKLWGKITKVTLGYGYQPWRALLFLATVVALSCVLAVALGAHWGSRGSWAAGPGAPAIGSPKPPAPCPIRVLN